MSRVLPAHQAISFLSHFSAQNESRPTLHFSLSGPQALRRQEGGGEQPSQARSLSSQPVPGHDPPGVGTVGGWGGQSLDTTLQAWRQWGAGPGKAVCRWDPLSVWVFLLT